MKRITDETLYEAMSGIGEDLLSRSEEAAMQAGKGTGKRFRRFRKKIVFGVAAAAALFLIAILAANTLRFSGKSGSAVNDYGMPASVQEEQAKTEEKSGAGRTQREKADAETQTMNNDRESAAEEVAEDSAPMASAGDEEQESESSVRDAVTATADMPAMFVFNGILYQERAGSRLSAEEVTIGEYVTTIKYGIDEMTDTTDYREGTGSVAGDVYTVSGKDPGTVLCMQEENGTVLLLYAEK